VKKKVVAKPKPKAKPKKKVITEEQKQKAELKALKVTALTPPKGKPATAWAVLLTDMMKNHTSGDKRVASASAEAAAKYKSLTTEELEVNEEPPNRYDFTKEHSSSNIIIQPTRTRWKTMLHTRSGSILTAPKRSVSPIMPGIF
jgi:hypothetical protein